MARLRAGRVASSESPKSGDSMALMTVRIRIVPSGPDCPPVVFKTEGGRFRHLACTDTSLKLRKGMVYGLVLKLDRAHCALPALGEEPTLQLTIWDESGKEGKVEHVALRTYGATLCATWLCNMAVSKEGERQTIRGTIELKGVGHVEIPLLVKVYSDSDRKCSLNGHFMEHARFSYHMDPHTGAPLLKSFSVESESC